MRAHGVKVPGDDLAEQAKRTLQGPLPNGDPDDGIYQRLLKALDLPDNEHQPILWEAPFVDNRMRAQRGMFLATTAPTTQVEYSSFDLGLGSPEEEKQRVNHLCDRDRGRYARPSIVVFYISARMREQVTRELDRRFGYRTETIYPDLAGFALANAPNRALEA